MKTSDGISSRPRKGLSGKQAWWAGATLATCLALVSCMTGGRTIIAPPSIPGATFAGSESCVDCHANISRDFHTATHAAVSVDWSDVGPLGCETCHGPASLHVESGGALQTILNPGKTPQTCFNCHLEMRSRFNLPHHHPLVGENWTAGQVSCGDCHASHKGPAIHPGASSLSGINDGCIQCHPAQRGPFAFEHEALREGCVICHDPHGSVNNKMLVQRDGNLCLKCHLDVKTSNITIGGLPHQFLMTRGTCWTAGCHEAVHGSQVSSSLRF